MILLYDPETGVPKAAIDGNYITASAPEPWERSRRAAWRGRTRAGPPLIGAGVQGAIQLAGLREVLPLEEVRCYDRDTAAGRSFTATHRATACDTAAETIAGADVVVTATPSFQPIVEDAWIRPGTHISAFGADTRGKQELEERRSWRGLK